MKAGILLLCLLLWTAGGAQAAAIAAADQAGGYADQVLEKVARHWAPPVDSVDRKVRVRVSIDGDGKVLRCEPVASSASSAMDKSACAAVREAGSFGTPPYGLPIDVAMSFWTGKPTPNSAEAAPQAETPTPADKAEPAKAETPKTEAPKTDPAPAPAKAPAKTAAAKPAPAKADNADTKYVDSVMAKIRPHVVLPSKLADGKYTCVVLVRVDGRGQDTRRRSRVPAAPASWTAPSCAR